MKNIFKSLGKALGGAAPTIATALGGAAGGPVGVAIARAATKAVAGSASAGRSLVWSSAEPSMPACTGRAQTVYARLNRGITSASPFSASR